MGSNWEKHLCSRPGTFAAPSASEATRRFLGQKPGTVVSETVSEQDQTILDLQKDVIEGYRTELAADRHGRL